MGHVYVLMSVAVFLKVLSRWEEFLSKVRPRSGEVKIVLLQFE